MNLTPKNYQKKEKINLIAVAYCAATGDFFVCLRLHLRLFELRPIIRKQGEGTPRDGKSSKKN